MQDEMRSFVPVDLSSDTITASHGTSHMHDQRHVSLPVCKIWACGITHTRMTRQIMAPDVRTWGCKSYRPEPDQLNEACNH